MRLTPDGQRYIAMARGGRQPMPFHLRWLLPKLLRDSPMAWAVVSRGSILATAPLVGVLALQRGLWPEGAAVAALLWLGLPCNRFRWQCPVLADQVGALLMVAAAVLAPVHLPAAVALSVLGAAVNEKVPVFAACFAWQPWLLLGVVAVAARRIYPKPPPVAAADPHREILSRPLRAGLMGHAGRWRSPEMMLPWGACLLALLDPSLWWLAAVALGYAQLLVATDTVRLYQMAGPAVAVAAAGVVPIEWALLMLALHWFHPWQGSGL